LIKNKNMKILKRIGMVLLLVLAILLIAGLFIKNEYTIAKEVMINKPNDTVFKYIKYLKNQDNYSVWNRKDPKSIKTYVGQDATVGFLSSWDSQDPNIGAGTQEITKIEENKRFDLELRFKRPMESTATAFMSTEKISENSTKVTWSFTGKFDYPVNAIMPLIGVKKMLGNDMQKSLDDLKVLFEK
jgi:Polyketide cyclase / dehydrase and lipid transport